jgi:hypothetical protein
VLILRLLCLTMLTLARSYTLIRRAETTALKIDVGLGPFSVVFIAMPARAPDSPDKTNDPVKRLNHIVGPRL